MIYIKLHTIKNTANIGLSVFILNIHTKNIICIFDL